MHAGRTWAALMASRGSAEEQAGYAWDQAGIPARFRGLRLATHPLMAGSAAAALRGMVAGDRPRPDFWNRSWYLWGDVGVGKTGLAVGYAYQWVDPAYGEPARVVYTTVPDLLGRLRASYDPHASGPAPESEWEIVRRCREADLLILDDLGAEQTSRTGWVEDRLLLIVGWRHDEELPTIFTGNLSPREVAAEIGERVVWRIIESCGDANVVHVQGPNLRTTSRKGV